MRPDAENAPHKSIVEIARPLALSIEEVLSGHRHPVWCVNKHRKVCGMIDPLVRRVAHHKRVQDLREYGRRRPRPCDPRDRELGNPAQEASDRTKEQWKSILDNIPRGGTDTGAHVKETLSAHAREAQAAMRSSREAGLKVMHTLTQNYATLVSGVLIGLSEALEHGKPKTKH